MPAVAAVIAAEAVTATMVAAAVAQVGVAMTVVGAVTGSKGLMKAGSVLSLAGGIGSIATGMAEGAAGVAAESAGTAAGTEATGEALDLFYGTDAASQSMTQAATQGLPVGETVAQSAADVVGPGAKDILGDGLMTTAQTEVAQPGLMQSAPVEQAVTGAPVEAPTVADAPATTGVSAPEVPSVGGESYAGTVNKATEFANKAKETGMWGDFKKWYEGLSPTSKTIVSQLGFGAMQGAAGAYAQDKQLEYLKERDNRFAKNASAVVPIKYTGIMAGVK